MVVSIKESNPQKYCIKLICDVIFYLGLGNCSSEEKKLNKKQRYLYNIWVVISNFYVFSIVINELMANFRTDLNEKEKSDLLQFSFAHIALSGKIIITHLQKNRISVFLRMLFEDAEINFDCTELNRRCVKRCLFLCAVIVGAAFFTIFSATLDGIKVYLAEGVPIRTEVTYFPPNSSSGLYINILRFFIHLHWWYIVSMMLSIDCLCVCSLVIVGYKFKILQAYLEKMRENTLNNILMESREFVVEKYQEQFVAAIKMHEKALGCAKNVQFALGNLYSVQVFESVALLAMCLFKLVVNERNVVFLLANSAYIFCLLILTGAYMMAAGDVSHEASEVSTSMFHSGWDVVRPGRRLRALIVVALQRSQVPVFMTAFGVMTLSYARFISVIRLSYSFFAVMY